MAPRVRHGGCLIWGWRRCNLPEQAGSGGGSRWLVPDTRRADYQLVTLSAIVARPPDPFRADRPPFQCTGQRATCHRATTAQARACHIRPLQASDRPAAPNSCDDATQPWSSPLPNPLTLAVVAWGVDARTVTHAGYGTLTDAGGYGNPVPLLIGVSALMSFSAYMHGVYSCGGVICTVV